MSSETAVAPEGIGPHDDEPHQEGIGGRLNALRAAVLGANDGIVSVAGIVMGVAGATSHADAIFVAGGAGPGGGGAGQGGRGGGLPGAPAAPPPAPPPQGGGARPP